MARVLRTAVRWVLWLLVAWVALRGVVSFLPKSGPAQPAASTAVAEARDDPVRTFAVLFSQEYLTWRGSDAGDHAARLKPYLAANVDEQAGWQAPAGSREQTAAGGWVVGDQRLSATRRLITVAARVALPAGASPASRVIYLAVPVTYGARGMAVDGLPALVPGPARVEPAGPLWGDPVSEPPADFRPLVEGFLKAYVAGSEAEMAYFMPAGTRLSGLRGSLVWVSLDDVRVYRDNGELIAVAEGTLRDPASGVSLRQGWALRLEQRDRWYIKDLLQKGVANP